MKLIVFCGGTGKRFWPASRKKSPKQFLPVVEEKPLVRLAVDRLLKGYVPEDIFISTGKRYELEAKEILSEIPDRNFILEPEMMDTGPAVTLATSYVHKLFPNEVVAILWSDHLVKNVDSFVLALKKAEERVKLEQKIVFLTVPARFASPHRGYINFGEEVENYTDDLQLRKFVKFVEKPTVDVAKSYLEAGTYGWNPGYWVMRTSDFLNTVEKYNPGIRAVCQKLVDSNFAEGVEEFKQLEKLSADYMFAEHVEADQALCILAEIGWSDVGEWIALKEALEVNEESNVSQGNVFTYETRDSIIHNYQDGKLVVTVNLDGFVVVNTEDVIAIFKKEDNNKLKNLLKELEDKGYDQYL